MRGLVFGLGLLALLDGPAHAAISIGCGGYNPSINDHVEWDITISGKNADEGGTHFAVQETKRYFVLTRPGVEIRIDKLTKSYVEWGPKGRKAPRVEWSRKVPGEGCDISR